MKKPKAPRLVTVAIFTTVTVLFWIFFSVYNVLVTRPESKVSPELLEPVNPTLDVNSLEMIEKRVYFERGEVTAPIIEAAPVTSPAPEQETEEPETESEPATPAAQLEE